MSTLKLIGGALVVVLAARRLLKKRQELPLPPSPPADPLIGHLRVFPSPQDTAEVFHEWSRQYGDIFSLQVLGKTIIVLTTEKVASELLEKRSAIYSDRVRFAYYDGIGWGDAVILAPYGPFFTRQRKMYNDTLGKNVVQAYRGVQEREANTLLKGLLDSPNDFERHASRFAGGIVTDIGYGHRIESFDDDFFSMGERFLEHALAATAPNLMDLHPVFSYLPSWVPGAWCPKFIKETKPFMDSVVEDSYHRVIEEIKAGAAQPSFVARNLEAMYGEKHDPEQERALKMAAVMIFAAGFETSWRAISIFIACMLLHPKAQQRAQQEIDRVVGRDRLPDLDDRDSLPYVQCVINEVLRWQPITPMGLPHRVMADDVYNGMFIPKGAIIFANTRSMTWDEDKYHDPQTFKPERFLPKPEGAGETFSPSAIFGWGRRACAGRYLAENSMWTAVARILAVFNISPTIDAEGRATKPDVKFTTMMTRSPEPFACLITPRDEKARNIILDSST